MADSCVLWLMLQNLMRMTATVELSRIGSDQTDLDEKANLYRQRKIGKGEKYTGDSALHYTQ